MSGTSVIYGFPFRVYGEPNLPVLDGQIVGGGRVRIHRPFCIRKNGMPLSPDVPHQLWPGFNWSLSTPNSKRSLPVRGVSVGPSYSPNHSFFDGLRIDAWGQDASKTAYEFLPLFARWMRFLTRQPWVGNFEFHTDFLAKYEFAIDGSGYAVDSIFARARATTPMAQARPLNAQLYREAFESALAGKLTPSYWEQWLDAALFVGMDRPRDAALGFALALELARDVIFPRFAATKMRANIGPVLASPFDDTDLLKHLSSALDATIGRSLERELPAVFGKIRTLYIVRHKIAHGKSAAEITAATGEPIGEDRLREWNDAAYTALMWMEKLPGP
jgi:hypothetical protein